MSNRPKGFGPSAILIKGYTMLNYDTANTIQFIGGLSTDEKPKDDIRIGSVFTEIRYRQALSLRRYRLGRKQFGGVRV